VFVVLKKRKKLKRDAVEREATARPNERDEGERHQEKIKGGKKTRAGSNNTDDPASQAINSQRESLQSKTTREAAQSEDSNYFQKEKNKQRLTERRDRKRTPRLFPELSA